VTTRLTLYPLTATARWELWFGAWRPYLLAGAGAEITRIRPTITVADGGPLGTPRTRAALLLQGGAGLVYQVDEHFAFGLEGRYVRARLEGGDLATDGVTASATMEYRY
jgi:opacity protein-like surface antigen